MSGWALTRIQDLKEQQADDDYHSAANQDTFSHVDRQHD